MKRSHRLVADTGMKYTLSKKANSLLDLQALHGFDARAVIFSINFPIEHVEFGWYSR